MRVIETKVYTFDELSEEAKEKMPLRIKLIGTWIKQNVEYLKQRYWNLVRNGIGTYMLIWNGMCVRYVQRKIFKLI
jgi:hypothetical protein